MSSFLRPLDFECTIHQGFGDNANDFYRSIGLKAHPGVDEACGYGSEVKSYVEGYVYAVYTPENPASDGYTAVYMLCKTPLETFEFSVGHLSRVDVVVGQYVKEGDVIGLEGNKGTVYSGGQRITRAMQDRGDTRGSHRHVQKRPYREVSTISPHRHYLYDAYGIYKTPEGKFCEIVDYWNGYNGCVDFTRPLWKRDLFFGMSGYDVALLQKALVQLGYGDFEPTGFYGTKTTQAVARYQKEAGLTPTVGYCGTKTKRLLNATYNQLT